MHRLAAGVILLLFSSLAIAQPVGEVEGIGFNNQYRPDCWTPMVVRIKPGTAPAGTYQIQVTQNDLDRDHAVFTRTITLNAEDQANDQRFWMYFIPQATDQGLPDPMLGLNELNKSLKVYLCNDKGKPLAALPITTTVNSIDPVRSAFDKGRGKKLILCVHDGRSQPAWKDYAAALGIMEDVEFVSVQPRSLPESILGYDAVDAIVWLNADPIELIRGGENKLDTLRQWVRQGGKLVICTPAEWQKVLGFKDLLPVTIQGVHNKNDLSPLMDFAHAANQPVNQIWKSQRGQFTMALATADKNAVVAEWIDWGDAVQPSRSPYLVRTGYGLGSVTWVAQDLGDPNITLRTKVGWPYVWDKVLDWKNDTRVITNTSPPGYKAPYDLGGGLDLGASFIRGMEPASRTSWFIGLAVVFFVVYWLAAGPGSYLWLAQKKQTRLSWFIFGASAVVATLVTVVVVRLVLRGDPEIQHISFVRVAPGEPAVVNSRFGLYIPRDGEQQVELRDNSPDAVSTISAFAIHPQYLKSDSRFSSTLDYTIPVRDAADASAVAITVPYRSTLKKLQTRWIGPMEKRVTGSAKLLSQESGGWIEGKLANSTDQDLQNVYIVFNYPYMLGDDWVIYIPRWEKNQTIDLNTAFNKGFLKKFNEIGESGTLANVIGRAGRPAVIDEEWLNDLRGKHFDENYDDSGRNFARSFPISSLYERLGPIKNTPGNNDRVEVLRRGARELDISHTVGAGNLVVLAQTARDASPLPFPLAVNGSKIDGTGTTFYQFVLPLDRSNLKEEVMTSER